MKALEVLQVSEDDCIETVTVEEVLLALDRAPSKGEVLDALYELRRDRVKVALGEVAKAAKFDRRQAVEEFLIDGRRGPRTQAAYRLALDKLFAYADMMGIPLIGMTRADANRFRKWLEERPAKNRGGKLKANSQRLVLAAVSAFWKYLEVTGVVQTNPWAGLALPRHEFKHRPRPEGDEPTVPVMSDKEYEEILNELDARRGMKAVTTGQSRMKESARRLLPFVRLLGETGLRLGDALSMKLEEDGKASFKTKGGKVRVLTLPEEMARQFKVGPQRPFADWNLDSTGAAIARLGAMLHDQGRVRYAYTAHDFRHRFAMKVYKETRDVLAVQRALGHASLGVTQVYLQGFETSAI
ncbi:MAG TPA: tyrosine-type recombinase/integrase [Rectinemataceae bacterium]|nr:tyrosine-type recombinase/integrase [Rectinemataceae bacterium]